MGEHGRDRRKADPVNVSSFVRIMRLLSVEFRWVHNATEMKDWTEHDGWALMPKSFAQEALKPFLGDRTCLRSPIGLFWDVCISPNRAASHRPGPRLRKLVLERDGHRCIQCRKSEEDGMKLTMDHVIPFSRGGETTAGSLVTLCESCNQGHRNEEHPHLFVLAGLDHDWDPDLLSNCVESHDDARMFAIMLSKNIMVSRCRHPL